MSGYGVTCCGCNGRDAGHGGWVVVGADMAEVMATAKAALVNVLAATARVMAASAKARSVAAKVMVMATEVVAATVVLI